MTRKQKWTRIGRYAAFGVLLAAILFSPIGAWATSSAGMPWSGGMNQLGNEAKGGLAFVFIILGCVGGFVEFLNNGQLSMLLTLAGRAGIVIGVLGGIATFASLFGMSAAVV